MVSLVLALALWSSAHSPIAPKRMAAHAAAQVPASNFADLLPSFFSFPFHLGSLLPETLLLVPFGLPGGGDLRQGIVTQPDERARLIALDAEHVLAQQAHGPGSLHHLDERH